MPEFTFTINLYESMTIIKMMNDEFKTKSQKLFICHVFYNFVKLFKSHRFSQKWN